MKLHRILVPALALVLAFAPRLDATTVERLDLDRLVAAADGIVVGTVRCSETVWSPDGRLILTRHTIDVDATLKGAPSRTVEVTTIGGTIGELTLHVAGMASFEAGEQTVVFIENARSHRLVVGLGQGKFTVDGGMVTNDVSGIEFADGGPGRPIRMRLDDFVERIRRRAGP